MAGLAPESQRAASVDVSGAKRRNRVDTYRGPTVKSGPTRIDEETIRRAMKFNPPNDRGAFRASVPRRNTTFRLADNQLADLILKTPERDRWLYDPSKGLFHAPKTWDWALDREGAALGRRLKMLAEDEAEKAGKPLELRCGTLRGATTMVQQGVDAKPHWDRDVMLAGLPDGGVLDLSTGKPRPAERGDFVSRRLGVMPNRHVSPTRFLRFLGEMTGDIPGVVQWLRSYLGYLLTGHTVNHVALFLLGDGAAGKSTLVELLTHILGDYAARVPPDALVARATGKFRPAPGVDDGAGWHPVRRNSGDANDRSKAARRLVQDAHRRRHDQGEPDAAGRILIQAIGQAVVVRQHPSSDSGRRYGVETTAGGRAMLPGEGA